MFSMDIIDTDFFLDMPATTQLLYFHLSMRADDDGFISSPKRIVRQTGASDGDLRILFSKQFVIPFETGVCVIRHWKIHNFIQKDRYHETIYLSEKHMLEEDENRAYKMVPECIQNVSTMDPQVRLGKSKASLDQSKKLAQSDDSLSAGEEVKDPIFILPQLGGKEFPITQDQVETFSAAYPAVNVPGELHKMKAWLMSNKKNQKKNVMRFANAWLAKAQDQSVKVPPGGFQKPSQRTLGNSERFEADRIRAIAEAEEYWEKHKEEMDEPINF